MGFDQNFRMMWNGWWMNKSELKTYLFFIQKGNWNKLVLTQPLETENSFQNTICNRDFAFLSLAVWNDSN